MVEDLLRGFIRYFVVYKGFWFIFDSHVLNDYQDFANKCSSNPSRIPKYLILIKSSRSTLSDPYKTLLN